MDKILELLKKAGVSEELSSKIVESLEKYKTSIREQFEAEFAAKVEQAKKVCIEETEAHKRELARRVQIFCEAKSTQIENHVAKQVAVNESEALVKLREVADLVSGFSGDGSRTKAVNEDITEKLKAIGAERARAVEIANRQTKIAEKVLKENRRLATELAKYKQLVTESSAKSLKGVSPKKNLAKSTRPTIVENQDPSLKPATTPAGEFTIEAVAERISDEI